MCFDISVCPIEHLAFEHLQFTIYNAFAFVTPVFEALPIFCASMDLCVYFCFYLSYLFDFVSLSYFPGKVSLKAAAAVARRLSAGSPRVNAQGKIATPKADAGTANANANANGNATPRTRRPSIQEILKVCEHIGAIGVEAICAFGASRIFEHLSVWCWNSLCMWYLSNLHSWHLWILSICAFGVGTFCACGV